MQVRAARWNLMRVGVAVIAVALAFVASPAFGFPSMMYPNGSVVLFYFASPSPGTSVEIYPESVFTIPPDPADAIATASIPPGFYGWSYCFAEAGSYVVLMRESSAVRYWGVAVGESAGSGASGSVTIDGTPTVHVATMPSIGEVSLEGTPTVAVEGFDVDFRSSMFGATVLAVLGLFVVIGHRLTRGR